MNCCILSITFSFSASPTTSANSSDEWLGVDRKSHEDPSKGNQLSESCILPYGNGVSSVCITKSSILEKLSGSMTISDNVIRFGNGDKPEYKKLLSL